VQFIGFICNNQNYELRDDLYIYCENMNMLQIPNKSIALCCKWENWELTL